MSAPPNPLEAWAELADTLQNAVDLSSGQRAKLEAAGFSPTAAELAATHLHNAIITMIFAKATGS